MSTDATVKRLINGKEGRGVNRYMLEEVYFSEACENSDPGKMYNPQNARYETSTGRWYFNFPDMWYNNLSTSKAIGLRKIDVIAKPLDLSFHLIAYWVEDGQQEVHADEFPIRMLVPINESTDDICLRLTSLCTKAMQSKWKDEVDVDDLTLTWSYNHRNHSVKVEFFGGLDLALQASWAIALTEMSQDMQDFLTIDIGERVGKMPTQGISGDLAFTFPTVWNRQTIFFHASFVTGTSFNYLGRSGEFYPAPSKMYPASHSSQQFYFQISYDGMHPVKFRNFLFFIDLAYIYYDKDYNGD